MQEITSQNTVTGVKHDQQKDPTELLPTLPLRNVSRVLGFGRGKYGADNWRNGIEYRRLYGATLRHLFAWNDGEDLDPETGLSHIDHALCELLFLSQFIHEGRGELDDRFKVEKPKAKWVNERGLPMEGEPPKNLTYQIYSEQDYKNGYCPVDMIGTKYESIR